MDKTMFVKRMLLIESQKHVKEMNPAKDDCL